MVGFVVLIFRVGIAEGAGVSFPSVLALNARTEISMGMMNDGCTSLAWRTGDFSVAGQNWDVRLLEYLVISVMFANVASAPVGRAAEGKISSHAHQAQASD